MASKVVRAIERIDSEAQRDAVKAMIDLAYDTGKVHEVTIDRYVKKKTISQHRTFMGLVRYIAEELGNDFEAQRAAATEQYIPNRLIQRRRTDGTVVQAELPKSWSTTAKVDQDSISVEEANYAIKTMVNDIYMHLGGEKPRWIRKIHDAQ